MFTKKKSPQGDKDAGGDEEKPKKKKKKRGNPISLLKKGAKKSKPKKTDKEDETADDEVADDQKEKKEAPKAKAKKSVKKKKPAKKQSKKSSEKKKSSSALVVNIARFLDAMPVALLFGLMITSAWLAWQLFESGKKEGSVSYKSGRYAIVEITSKNVQGNLLPPMDSVPTSLIPDQGPDVTNPELNIPMIAVPDEEVKLRPAPNMALIEKEGNALLPKASADGVQPWDYYARPHTPNANAKQISVIVTGLGVHNDLSLAAAKLPSAISFSISPYAKNPGAWVKSMRVQGHECYLDLPVELDNYPLSDPGPMALQPSITPKENQEHLTSLLGKAVGYSGFVVPADEVFFIAEQDFIEPVVKDLSERGLALIFSQSKSHPALKEIIDKEELVSLGSHVYVRYGSDSVAIRQQLSSAEAVAQQRGHSLIVIEASPVVLQELAIWAKSLRSNGFQLAPVSALAKEEFS